MKRRHGNPTLVHHGKARAALWHVLNGDGHPIADLYVRNVADAQAIARGLAARLRTRTFGQKYGPGACIVPRDSTTGDNVQYAPPSMTKSTSSAVSVPSARTPVRIRVRDGCRLVVATMSSARS